MIQSAIFHCQKTFFIVYAFNGAISGTTEDSPNYALSNNSILSFGEKKLVSQSTLSDQGIRFDSAAISIEREGWNQSAGLLRSISSQLIGDVDMAGISLASSA